MMRRPLPQTWRSRAWAALLPWLLPGLTLAQGGPAAPALGIVQLQAWRSSDSVVLHGDYGQPGEAALTQLSPASNAWLLLTLRQPGRTGTATYHLENADPAHQRIALDRATPGRLLITQGTGSAVACTFWPGNVLDQAARERLPFAALCDGRLYLRNAVQGNRSTLEATTEFLRDHVWRGEQIVAFVKREFYRDAFAEHPAATPSPSTPVGRAKPAGAPPDAPGQEPDAQRAVLAEGLGIALDAPDRAVLPGRWYGAAGLDHVYVSVAASGVLAAAQPAVLDPIEAEALSFLVAFDLSAFELGFTLGTEHPRLGWATRVRAEQRDERLPGPDGLDSAAPLVRTGMLAPPLLARVVATFTGGFKREHGAFHAGALAAVNHGSHYGFIEQGVVFSTLLPGLATLLVHNDGTVEMKTWRAGDNVQLASVRHARQNGVPLLEPGLGGQAVVGRLVERWTEGNWSGSADERLRTLRAGACLIEDRGRRFLVYGYFSTATPRAMARTFQAYGCRYAMHLDMNALEHTYLALYPRQDLQLGVEHLVAGMAVLDKHLGATLLPRFLGFADDRDFFYLTERRAAR